MRTNVKFGCQNLRTISVYVPHAGYMWAEFEQCMDDVTILVSATKRLGMKIIIGGDLNLSLDIGRRATSRTEFFMNSF